MFHYAMSIIISRVPVAITGGRKPTIDAAAVSRCAQPHRHAEWLDFLRQFNRETPKEKERQPVSATTT